MKGLRLIVLAFFLFLLLGFSKANQRNFSSDHYGERRHHNRNNKLPVLCKRTHKDEVRHRNSCANVRIHGGVKANFSEYPYLASVVFPRKDKEGIGKYYLVATATIITDTWILTYRLSYGTSALVFHKQPQWYQYSKHEVNWFDSHTVADKSGVLLGKVSPSFNIRFYQVAYLPKHDFTYVPGTDAKFVGFGIPNTEHGRDELFQLRSAKVKLKECKHGKWAPDIEARMLCADGKYYSCGGDEAAPLVQNGIVIGVLLSDFRCEEPKPLVDSVFVRTSYLLRWISNTVYNSKA